MSSDLKGQEGKRGNGGSGCEQAETSEGGGSYGGQ